MSDTESSSTSILVTQRNEEDTENDIEIEEIPVKKARKASRVYNHHADFETYNQALDMIKNKFEGYSWAAKEKQKSTIGDKEFFKCSSCDKRLYIFKPNTNSSESIFVEEEEHVHIPKTRGVPEQTNNGIKT
ncbi:hypothetical protein BpHYR1_044458 [Brachionus plicatilis]|uniref:Uncharacterized protein n=1 Tax=Brachionus plicatilis TaxID=10195 RepID=A0A3M7RJB0_BRAPC|nr:hypothetical protein BpHYR1_044458 [Brachionus plicatilis]